LRQRHDLHEGDEVDVIEDGGTLRIVRIDQLMELLRGEDQPG
jgi:bifunctional DNA-binding transcriptional regulator/antitoxin component of YhaV-PrlF toxin-antitoxin module